ncbi:hypothetical protein [Mangrovibacter plantisponsor]|uniref:Uncharacterized protein n=1 Tax=Mangrovibacter plantisponsor TaxID=451513 RepID=A0A317PLC2_9ENTR|nr:hypothetical protein [Mangrovibacter plantisponsor]PWW00626.1 hypothetical protein DES37_1254 [Mangrovibacter plantisponsor]
MYIEKFLTEYDDSLTGELNVDPLGQLVIWSSWGQDIFHSRITSIANDVRQYTLNLLHHSVLRQILVDEKLQTSGAMKGLYPKKQLQEFRVACLIHLENIYIYSMLAAENRGVTLTGVQGINKARPKWNASNKNPQIFFGHEKSSELLTNQIALGTNGRYKSPMMKMQFFSADYHYDLPENKPVWQAAEAFIRNVPELKELHAAAITYMQSLMQVSHKRDLNPFYEDIPVGLKKAYVKAFRDPKMVGDYSREFWLQRTGLDKYAAGAIYRVLKQERSDELELTDAEVFKRAMQEAKSVPEMNESDLMALQHISQAEPFLSLIDLMFSGLRRQSRQTLAEFRQFWQSRGLTELDLPQRAAQLLENDVLLSSLSGTPDRRFRQLLALASMPSLEDQVRGLLDYHHKIMETRGQFPWLMLEGDDILLQVPPCSLREDRQNSDWVNRYYLPQFRHLLNGLWGHSA